MPKITTKDGSEKLPITSCEFGSDGALLVFSYSYGTDEKPHHQHFILKNHKLDVSQWLKVFGTPSPVGAVGAILGVLVGSIAGKPGLWAGAPIGKAIADYLAGKDEEGYWDVLSDKHSVRLKSIYYRKDVEF